MTEREKALADYRARIHAMFEWVEWDTLRCSVCGQSDITEQNIHEHYREHSQSLVLLVATSAPTYRAKMYETVKALFG